jgi:hypothetical protein
VLNKFQKLAIAVVSRWQVLWPSLEYLFNEQLEIQTERGANSVQVRRQRLR